MGKVFTREELTVIADLCKKFNVLCISDEVYEWMVYEPHEHIRMGMYYIFYSDYLVEKMYFFLLIKSNY